MTDDHIVPYPCRLNVAITAEQHKKLQQHLPWGLRKQVFGKLTEALIRALEIDSRATIDGILYDHITFVVKRREDGTK